LTYSANLPVSGDTLGGTRDRIRANFQIIENALSINHETFGSSFGQGKHKFLQMPEQGTAPTTAVNEGGVYTKVGTNPAETNLYFRAEDSGGVGGFEYQLTKVISASTARFANNTINYVPNNNGGWTFLSGGMIFQYGSRTSAGSSGSVIFPLVFPSGNAPFSINLTIVAASGNILISVVSSNSVGFDFDKTSGTHTFYWMAIGN
jgi:hypothetical protein